MCASVACRVNVVLNAFGIVGPARTRVILVRQ